MKQIFLIRHGKAEDYDFVNSDFERCLTKKGKQISREVAEKIAKKDFVPEIIYTSPAFRAIETAIIFADVLKYSYSDLKICKDIYSGFDIDSLREIISELDNRVNSVAIVGHNPGLSDIAEILCKSWVQNIPKTGVVIIESKAITWTEFEQNETKIVLFEQK